jgi:outer membrane usher protein
VGEGQILPESPVILPVEVNGQECGDSRAVVRRNDVLVAVEDLARCDVRLVGILETFENASFVSLKSAVPPVEWALDPDQLVLRLRTTAQAFSRRTLDLRGLRSQAPLAPWEPSGSMTYALRWTDDGIFRGFLQGTASTRYGPLVSTALLSSERGMVRGLTNFTIDRGDDLVRVILGDALVSSGGLGGAAFVGGFTARREVGLRPGTPVRPGLFFSDAVENPATLEVYIQDRLVARRQLEPGPFSVVTGSGTGLGGARYVVRDILGNSHEVTQTFYGPSALLAKGYSDYSHSFGMRRRDFGQDSWDYDVAAAVSRYRVGITDWFTLGLRGELLGLERVNTGLSLAAVSPLAEFELAGAASAEQGVGNGFAASVTAAHVQRRLRVDTSLRLVDGDYSNISLSGLDDRALFQFATRARVAVTRTAGISFEGAALDFRDRGWNRRITLSGDWFAKRFLSLRSNVTMEDFGAGSPVYSASVVAAFRLDNLTLISPSIEKSDGREEFAVDVARAASFGPGVSGRLRAATGSRSEVLGQVRGDTPWMRVEVDGSWANDRDFIGQAGVVGSLVYIDRSLHVARPVGDSFALVRTPKLSGVGVDLNRIYVGRTDFRGALVVPQLFPYNGVYVSVNPDDVPLDRELDPEGVHVAVPFGNGTTLSFAERRFMVLRGHLYLDDKTPVPAGSEVRVVGKTDLISPVGHDGLFEFLELGPGTHRLVVEYAQGRCMATIEVSKSDDGELGKLRCAPVSPPSSSP